MTFLEPHALFALLGVPVAALAYVALEVRRARRVRLWSNTALLPNLVRSSARRWRHMPAVLFLLALACLLVGFARPQRVRPDHQSGAPTIAVVVDVSGSMAASDVTPTRLQVARSLAQRFIASIPGRYRVTVISFADKVRLLVPPTLDHSVAAAGLPRFVTPLSGTSLGDGVNHAVSTIVAAAGQTQRASLFRPGAVLLLSDGVQTAGGASPREAAISALVDYIPVDTVAIGSENGSVIQQVQVQGGSVNASLPVPVGTAPLDTLAEQTNGHAFTAAQVAKQPRLLSGVYAGLRAYAPDGKESHELSGDVAGLAILLALAGVLITGLVFGRPA
jgi:Ca-activated chloride channel family protein